jgi:hypothetical protein
MSRENVLKEKEEQKHVFTRRRGGLGDYGAGALHGDAWLPDTPCYCCANQCRNCPYINWRQQATWQPAPAEKVQHAQVSPKALNAAQTMANHYEQALTSTANNADKNYAQTMLAHYRLLLERWESNNGA